MLTLLVCKHTVVFSVSPPKVGDTVYCRRCTRYRGVARQVEETRIRCQSCRYSPAAFGEDRDAASRAASRHAIKHQGHRVMLLVDDEMIDMIVSDGGDGGMLPFQEQVEARLADNRAHQALLRRPLPRVD